jgi:sn-glycerol 3-phosphate transport system permease protein
MSATADALLTSETRGGPLLRGQVPRPPGATTLRMRRIKDWGLALTMLAPSLIILGVFVIYPLIRVIDLGRKRCGFENGETVCRSNGWDQYWDVARSNEFRDALWNTLKLGAITVPIGLVLGVALAILADKHVRGIGIFRTIFSSTVATSVAVASLIWLFLLNKDVGVLANWIGGRAKEPGLLNDESTALWAVSASSIWANLGFTFIITTAALQGVSRELYEAAWVDGASSWQRTTTVTLPALAPTLLFITVVLTSRAFQAYGEIDLLTGGGPNESTTTVTYLTYGGNSIIGSQDGLRAAVAVLLFLLLLVVSALQFRGFGKRANNAG